MFNSMLKVAALGLFAVVNIASASDLKSGDLVEVEGKVAKVHVDSTRSMLKGQQLQIHRLLATNSVLEGDPLYSYQEVGKVLVDEVTNSQYINVRIIQGRFKLGDKIKIKN